METTRGYLFIDMYIVLVYCYVDMLITSCLWGATTNLETQENYATATQKMMSCTSLDDDTERQREEDSKSNSTCKF